MDLGDARHYVGRAMSFLLVISAVFNALTGAFVGVRPAEPVAHQQVPSAVSVAQVVEQKAAPAAAAEDSPSADAPVPVPAPAPPLAPPLQTDRLLE